MERSTTVLLWLMRNQGHTALSLCTSVVTCKLCYLRVVVISVLLHQNTWSSIDLRDPYLHIQSYISRPKLQYSKHTLSPPPTNPTDHSIDSSINTSPHAPNNVASRFRKRQVDDTYSTSTSLHLTELNYSHEPRPSLFARLRSSLMYL